MVLQVTIHPDDDKIMSRPLSDEPMSRPLSEDPGVLSRPVSEKSIFQPISDFASYTKENFKSGVDTMLNPSPVMVRKPASYSYAKTGIPSTSDKESKPEESETLTFLKRPLGAMQAATAPMGGVFHALVSKPTERTTGFPSEYTDAIGLLATMGVSSAPLVAEKLSRMGKTAEELARLDEVTAMQKKISDDLYKLSNLSTDDKVEIGKIINSIPDAFRNPEAQEKIYHWMENPHGVQLTEEEMKHFSEHISGMRIDAAKMIQRIKDLGYPLDNEGFVHRIAKGKAKEFDKFDPETYDRNQDVFGFSSKSLSKKAGGLHPREIFGVEYDSGATGVVRVKDGKAFEYRDGAWVKIGKVDENGRVLPMKSSGILSDGKLRQATTKEIEAATPVRYHKNAFVNTAENWLQLKRVERNMKFLDKTKPELEKAGMATTDEMLGRKNGWKESDLPQFRGWYMEPKIASALNDFYGKNGDLVKVLSAANRFLVGSLFFNPLPHIANVAAHWYVGRGWANFTPKGIADSVRLGSKAIKDVVTQSDDYRKVLKAGGAMLLARTNTRDFFTVMMQKMGHEMIREPSKWRDVAGVLGYNKVEDFVRAWYNGAQKVLWAGGDAFMLQRVYELQEKGMPLEKAIAEAERHIPNYRLPPEIMQSRVVQQFLNNPGVVVFSRYHYGMFKSYAEQIRDLTSGDPIKMAEATGNLFSLALLQFGIYPMMDRAVQYGLDNPNASVRRSGPASIPHALGEAQEGKKTYMQAFRSVVSAAPSFEIPTELLFNKNMFTGKDIFTGGSALDTGLEAVDYARSKIGPLQNILKPAFEDLLYQFLVTAPTEEEFETQEKGRKYGQEQSRRQEKKLEKKYGIDQ